MLHKLRYIDDDDDNDNGEMYSYKKVFLERKKKSREILKIKNELLKRKKK